MSDVFRHRTEYHKPRYFPVVSTDTIEIGDLIFWDSSESAARPASTFTFGSSLGATQKSIAPKFLGMSNSRSASGDTDNIEVQSGGIKEYACSSTTFEIGDKVGIDDNAGGTALEDQKVIAVTESDKAIGIVTKRVSSADTKVEIELLPKFLNKPENEPSIFKHTITSDEDSNGYVELDTGLGVALGAVFVQVVNGTTGRNEAHDFEVEYMTGDDLGKVKISDGYSTTLDENDILLVLIFKEANS